jgi:hypothetical protein
MDRWTNRPRKSLSHDCCLQPLPFWWFLTWVCPTIGYPHAYMENLRWIFSRTSFAEPKNYMGLLMCVSITLWQTNITMEITIFNGKTHNKWSFSIVFCMFTRGYGCWSTPSFEVPEIWCFQTTRTNWGIWCGDSQGYSHVGWPLKSKMEPWRSPNMGISVGISVGISTSRLKTGSGSDDSNQFKYWTWACLGSMVDFRAFTGGTDHSRHTYICSMGTGQIDFGLRC